MSKFTKGEWEEGRNGISVFDEQREMTLFITDGVYGWTTEEAQANARLIVAAPSLQRTRRVSRKYIDWFTAPISSQKKRKNENENY